MNNYISLCNVRIDNFLVPFVYPVIGLKTYWASLFFFFLFRHSRLYKSFIRPYLDYAPIVWNPHLKDEIESGKCTNVCPSSLFEILGFWKEWAAQSCQSSTSESSTSAQEMSPLKPPSSTQNHSQLHNQCYFPPIFSARETRTHVNRSFLLTQPFSHSNSYFYSFVPNVTHCGIVYLNLLYVLPHSLFF